MSLQKVQANPHISRNIAIGDMDYVQGDQIIVGTRPGSVMVTDENDLSDLEGYLPGSIAYTAGFVDMWQLNASGTWVPLGGE